MPLTEIPELVIGSVTVPQRAGVDLRTQFQHLEGASEVRMASGALKKVTTWSGKLRVEFSGDGYLPTGLQPGALDYGASHVVRCPVPLSIVSASNVITVPAARRSDLSAEVIGVAILDGFEAAETAVALSVNEATLTTVAGAVGYQALYWPQFTAFLRQEQQTQDRRRARARWRLTASEV